MDSELFDAVMLYIPPEWRPLIVVGLLVAAAWGALRYFTPPQRWGEGDIVSSFMTIVRDQTSTAASIQKDLSTIREHAREVEAENAGLKKCNTALRESVRKLEEHVRQLIAHCRTMIRLVRRLDTENKHETALREIELAIEAVQKNGHN